MSELGPLPGDPDTVLRDGTRYQEAAEAIARAAQQLRSLSSDGFRSQAVSEIVSTAVQAADSITQAHTRYAEAAGALLDYAGPMRDAHDRADAVIAANRAAVDQLGWLDPQLEDARRQAELPGPDQAQAMSAVAQLQSQVDQVRSQMDQARREWDAANDELRHAAAVAAGRIHRGNEFGDLNDSFWDDLGDLFDIAKLVADIVSVVLKVVSIVLTVLAVVFAVLSVFFPVFAAIAVTLFAYAQLVNLVIAVLAMLQFALNGFHLLDLAIAGLAVLAAFGGAALGSALGAAAKSAAAGVAGALGEAAGKAAGELAKQAVTQAVGELTDQVVDGILDLGGDQARGLYDSLSGIGGDLLESAFGDDVSSFTDTMDSIGDKVGSDLVEGLEESGLASVGRAIAGAAQPVIAQVGIAVDSAYSAGSSVVDSVRGVIDSVQSSADQATQSALGGLFDGGMRDVASQIQHDLGSALGGPDVGGQVGDAVANRLSDAFGGIPGGDAIAHAVGDGFGGLAQSAHDAAQHPSLSATPAGASR